MAASAAAVPASRASLIALGDRESHHQQPEVTQIEQRAGANIQASPSATAI